MPDASTQRARSDTKTTHTLQAYWLAETLRLREALWGPVEDAAEVRRVRAQGGDFSSKVLWRAQYVGQREGLQALIARWRSGARLALLALAVAAIFAGVAAALGVLGDGSRPVNIVLALVGALGLNLLAFLFWALSFLLGDSGGTWLGEAWLGLTRKLARGPDAALVPRALVGILGRHGVLRWLLGSISHAWWSMATIALLIGLVAMLAARRYQFHWETTLLGPDAFVALTAALGWLPAHLGFAMPTEAMVRASDGVQQVPEAAQALWSGWLIGTIVVYGLLPRLLCLAISLVKARHRQACIGLDADLPGYAELRERLSPPSEPTGVDAPDQAGYQARVAPKAQTLSVTGERVAVRVELPGDAVVPPLPSACIDLGVVDSRAQRNALLERLQQQPPQRLLMLCDARQTPDRGVIGLLAELASLADKAAVALSVFMPSAHENARTETWQDRLVAAGFKPDQIYTDMAAATQWLGAGASAAETARGSDGTT